MVRIQQLQNFNLAVNNPCSKEGDKGKEKERRTPSPLFTLRRKENGEKVNGEKRRDLTISALIAECEDYVKTDR